MKKLLICCFLLIFPFFAQAQQAGAIDRSFNYGQGSNYQFFSTRFGADDYISSIAFQSNDKILIGGGFTIYNGVARNRIARLNADGGLDTNFNATEIGVNDLINSIAVQSDDKILIGKSVILFNGTSRNHIARLNTDGSLDTSFNPAGTGANTNVNSVVIQTDGKILIGGDINFYNGTTRNGIARLNSDGSLDTNFNTTGEGAIGVLLESGNIYSIALQSDGKILIGGNFNTYNRASRKRMARSNMDGTLDNSFNPGTGANDFVYSISVQLDGKILIGGKFTNYNGIARNCIARLNSDGSLDPTFNIGTGATGRYGTVQSIKIQTDGKILIGGSFNSFNGTTRNCIARLNPDGSLDNSFNTGTGANFTVLSIESQSDAQILLGGQFTRYNNLSTYGICRIMGSSDTTSIFSNKSKPNLALFPNPAQSQFSINLSTLTTIQIINALGQVLLTQKVNEGTSTISTASLPSGIYIILAEGYKATSLVIKK